MPRIHGEHDARLVLRLPRAMHAALKWTAQYDKLPLSDWVRNVLQTRCYSLRAYGGEATEQLIENESTRGGRVVATRPETGLGESIDGWFWWNGGRRDKTVTLPSYADGDGNKHLGSLPSGWAFDKDRQDLIMDRGEARRELTTWLNRWGPPGQDPSVEWEGIGLGERLLASFDEDPDP